MPVVDTQRHQPSNELMRTDSAPRLKDLEPPSHSGKPRQRTIRFRLTCLVLACVLPVCLTAGFLVYYSYQHKRRVMETSVLATARALSLVVDRELATMQSSATALATSPSLASGDLAAFHRQAQLVLRDYPDGDIILADPGGQQLVNSYVSFGKPLPKRNVPDAVRGVYATGRPFISNLFKGAVTGRPLISVDVPVFRGQQVVYDLALTVPAERLLAVLSQQRIPPEWTASIFDRNFVMAARNRFPERYVGLQANPAFLKRLTETAEGSIELPSKEGTDILAMFSRSKATGWTVSLGIPKAEFIADIWRSLEWAVCGIILLSSIGIGLALFLARRIAGSIQALIAPALALGTGEPVDIGQLDLAETNQVGQSLLRASELLRQRAAERERAEAVRRQAEELQRSNAELQRREADARAHAAELSAIIAERQRADEAVRESRERLRVTLNSIGDAVMTADGDGRVTFLNPVAERLTGWKTEEALNQTIQSVFQIINEQTRVAADDIATRVLEQGHIVELANHTALLTKDGREVPIEDSAAPILDGQGKVMGVVLVFHDVTEKRQAEQALLRSEKLASVGRMAASIAHEINNPLAAAMNTLYLAKSSLDEPESAQQYLDIADDELKRISHITRQTLGFYRESSAPTTVSINSIMDSAVDLLRGKIKVKGATIEKQYDGDLQIAAVSGELRQVFSNLLANSLDAIGEGGTIRLRLSRAACGNGGQPRIRVTVADNGKGIDAAVLPHIFEPLFSTKGSTGSGLGLWVSMQLIGKHQGSIRVRSSVNPPRRGTVFSILLPVEAAPLAQSAAAGSS